MKKIFIVAGVIILVVFVGVSFKNRLEARYANNPLAVLQDSFALSSDETKMDIFEKASLMGIKGLVFSAKKIKGEAGSYVGFCNIQQIAGDKFTSGIKGSVCNESLNNYAISIPVSSGKQICVDEISIRNFDPSREPAYYKSSGCNEGQKNYSMPISSGKYLCLDDSEIIRKLDRSLSVGEVRCPVTAPVVQ